MCMYIYVCKYNYQSVCVQRKINTQNNVYICIHIIVTRVLINMYVYMHVCMMDGWMYAYMHDSV